MQATAPAKRSATKLLIPVSLQEKAMIESRAREAGTSMSAFMREAALRAPEIPTPEQIAEIEKLTEEIKASAERMAAKLDRTIAKIDRITSPEYIAERDAAIKAELAANPVQFDISALFRKANA